MRTCIALHTQCSVLNAKWLQWYIALCGGSSKRPLTVDALSYFSFQPMLQIWYRCHYTKSNPIDDHSNISSKMLQKQNFKPACSVVPPIYKKSKRLTGSLQWQPSDSHKMSVAIFSPTPYINKWQMSLCNNSSDNKSYWIHRVDVKVSAQVTTVTYMHQSQSSLHSLRKHLTVHLELWPGNHLIWCNATYNRSRSMCYRT